MGERENPLEIHRIKNLAFSVASKIKTKKGYDLFIDALQGSWNELQDYENHLRSNSESEFSFKSTYFIYPDSPDTL